MIVYKSIFKKRLFVITPTWKLSPSMLKCDKETLTTHTKAGWGVYRQFPLCETGQIYTQVRVSCTDW